LRLLKSGTVNAQPFTLLLVQAAVAAGDSVSTTNAAAATRHLTLTREEAFTLLKDYGPKALGALILLVAGAMVARWVGNLTMRALMKREMEPPLRMLLVRLVKLLVIVLALVMAVQQLGFQLWPLIAGLSVAGVGVGLAMQGVLGNLVAGLTIIFVKKFRVGEYIELSGVHGQVDSIELFSTTLIHPDRSRVIVPNRKIVGEIIHNYGKVRQLDLSVGVGYGSDLNLALDVVNDILKRNPRVLKEPEQAVGASSLGDSSIVIAIKPWTSLSDYGAAGGEINKAIIERFREAGIEIPFPQREIRVVAGELSKAAA